MKINLHSLACELAHADTNAAPDKKRFSACVVSTETALAALGKRLRESSAVECVAIMAALVARGGAVKKKAAQ
jgi:hypothetical protein